MVCVCVPWFLIPSENGLMTIPENPGHMPINFPLTVSTCARRRIFWFRFQPIPSFLGHFRQGVEYWAVNVLNWEDPWWLNVDMFSNSQNGYQDVIQ